MVRSFLVCLINFSLASAAIGKVYSDGLKTLHRLCFGTPGVATTRKRDLRKFNGFPFEVESPEFEKKKTLAMKLNSSEASFNLLPRFFITFCFVCGFQLLENF